MGSTPMPRSNVMSQGAETGRQASLRTAWSLTVRVQLPPLALVYSLAFLREIRYNLLLAEVVKVVKTLV